LCWDVDPHYAAAAAAAYLVHLYSGRYASTAKKLSEFRSLLKFFKWFNNIRDLRAIVNKGYTASETTRRMYIHID
jgi:trimethylamine:corrinoid methyltransferase-like protein